MKKRLGELLLERRLIDTEQLNAALAHQRQWGIRLGAALVAKGFMAEATLMRVLSESLSIPMVDLSKIEPDPAALAMVHVRIAEQYEVFPMAVREQKGSRKILLLAMVDPLNVTAIDEIAFTSECIVKPAIAQMSSLYDAIQRWYHGQKREIAPLNFEPAKTTQTNEGAPIGGMSTDFQEFRDVSEPSGPVVMGVSVAQNPELEPFQGMKTGAFAVALPSGEKDVEPLELNSPVDRDAVEVLEKKFWALMRVLARRGLITKEEFLAELENV
jgi:hypothetical protein